MRGNQSVGKIVGKGAATAALIVLLCSVPATLFIQNISGSSGVQPLIDSATLAPPTSNDYYGDATQLYADPHSAVCVAFEFLSLDTASSNAAFGIVIGATQQGHETIQSDIKEGYTTPLLVLRSNAGLSSIPISVPISYLQSPEASPNCINASASYMRGAGFRVPQSIFVLGQPRAFPNDWYELDDTAAMYMCSSTHTQDECLIGPNQNGTLCLTCKSAEKYLPESLIATTRDQDLTMTVTRDQKTRVGLSELPDFQFTLQRSSWFIAYTYLIASMPFLLMIGLLTAYLHKRKDWLPERKIPTVYEIIFGVAATLVAILPLRAVLIPTSLPTLTRLDIFFGTGIALLVALSLASIFIWKDHASPPRPIGPDES
jgi:hypothetical protein